MERSSIKLQRPEYTGWYRHLYRALDVVFDPLPRGVGAMLATLTILVAGSLMKGDWLFIAVQYVRHHRQQSAAADNMALDDQNATLGLAGSWSLAAFKLQGLSSFIMFELMFSYSMYLFICGFLQWYFYIRRRDTSREWKCQPDKFLTPEIERHEIILGSFNIGVGTFSTLVASFERDSRMSLKGGVCFAFLACYTYNGGATEIYFNPGERGWAWFFLQIPVHFLYQDAAAYYGHRMLHVRFLYVNFHKWHHYYKHPTAFSATAMHPVELLFFQALMVLPAFWIPLHAGVYMGQMIYIFYYGLITHSGVEMESFWPWQPNVTFHDNHHQYFHVNFGFNTEIFDRLHGTCRRKDRVYNEQIYGGKGLNVTDVSDALKREHARELSAEIKLRK